MSQQNPVRLFVAHAWEESDDYHRIFEYLESARNFYYRNTSTPEHKPGPDPEARREDLRRQIGVAEILVAPASLYLTQPDLLLFEMNFAQSVKKPVLLVRPFGVQAVVPKVLLERADDVVDWMSVVWWTRYGAWPATKILPATIRLSSRSRTSRTSSSKSSRARR